MIWSRSKAAYSNSSILLAAFISFSRRAMAEEASKLSKKKLSDRERAETIARLEKEMKAASKMLEFEYAALLRDQIIELRKET